MVVAPSLSGERMIGGVIGTTAWAVTGSRLSSKGIETASAFAEGALQVIDKSRAEGSAAALVFATHFEERMPVVPSKLSPQRSEVPAAEPRSMTCIQRKTHRG